MNEIEYKERLKLLEQSFENAKKKLATECALENNTVKEGDVFTDHIGSIKVEKISTYIPGFGRIPDCAYYGLELKKDGTPTKKQTKRWAYQANKI